VALHIADPATGFAFEPRAIEFLGDVSKLDNEIGRQVLWLGLASFLLPQAVQGRFVIAHDDPRVGPSNETATALVWFCPQRRIHSLPPCPDIASDNHPIARRSFRY
jgi:hypothetical protein